jgi:hypothetical protein
MREHDDFVYELKLLARSKGLDPRDFTFIRHPWAPLCLVGCGNESLQVDVLSGRGPRGLAEYVLRKLVPRRAKLSQREGFKNRRAPVRRFFI